jgi:CDP-glucose 4,6-dehydratase
MVAEKLAKNRDLGGHAFNFSNEIQVTVKDLVEKILARMGSSLRPEIKNEASHEIRRQYLSAAKAREMLSWRPLFALEDGLDRTIRWYRDFLDAPKGNRA